MGVGMRIWRPAAFAAVLGALAFLAPNAGAVIVEEPNGHFLSVLPQANTTVGSIPGAAAAARAATSARRQAPFGFSSANGNVDYHGGPVVHTSAPYLVFWVPSGESIAAGTAGLLTRYFTDVAAANGQSSNVYGVARQYWDSTGFADYKQTFSPSQVIVDAQPYPTSGCVGVSGSSACLTDLQIIGELSRLIGANGLPTDGSASQLNPNAPIYFVVLPTGVDTCTDSFSTDCTSTSGGFCAYHSSFNDGLGHNVLYANIPLIPALLKFGTLKTGKQCQFDGNSNVQTPNGDPVADIALKYLSHEDNETHTDPIFGPSPTGWWYQNSGGTLSENGDNCNAFNASKDPNNGGNPNAFAPTLNSTPGALFNQSINGNSYYLQSEWSDGNNNCELRPTAGSMSASLGGGPASPVPVGTTVGFTTTASSTNPYSSVTIDFGDGSSSFDSSGAAPAPSFPHTYTHAGRFTATFSVVDSVGNIASSSTAPFTVGSAPHASFSASPSSAATGVSVNFNGNSSSDPDAGIGLSGFAFNFGDGGTAAGATPSHTYSKPGTYTVTLVVVNSIGLFGATSHSITIVKPAIGGVKIKHKNGKGAEIDVTVNAPGRISVGGKSKNASGPGTFKVKFKLSKGQQAQLASAGHLTVHLKLTFKPTTGQAVTKKITIVF
jgi:PKD repeat protein